MGGGGGELRGRTKFQVYERYKEKMQDQSWVWHPRNKKDAKKAMIQDPRTKECVLRFRVSK